MITNHHDKIYLAANMNGSLKVSKIIFAFRSPIPGITASSSTVASAIFFKEPKFSRSSIASGLLIDFIDESAVTARV